MAAFSRLQLAAALLEYENDRDDPSKPYISAQDSAIFAHLRRATRARRGSGEDEFGRRSADYLGVSLPSEAGMSVDPGSTRKSTASADLMRNPFSAEDDGGDEEEAGELDLASWGLDTFLPKEKGSRASKGKAKAKSDIALPNPHRPSEAFDRGRAPTRAISEFGIGGANLESGSATPPAARRSSSIPLDAADSGDEYERPRARRRHSDHILLEDMPVRSPLHSAQLLFEQDTIPFPTSEPIHDAQTLSRPPSRFDAMSLAHNRTYSTATMGTVASRSAAQEETNPFAVPPPPPSRASRFDPKMQAHARKLSNATMLSAGVASHMSGGDKFADAEDAPFAGVHNGEYARSKRLSTASYGTRQMLDNDVQSVFSRDEYGGRERRYSRLELMRPKVLIMPSPLQNANLAPSSLERPTREGFIDSSDGRPLPPGARSSRALSTVFPSNAPVASNSFTPNPRLSLSASQLLFRNTLMVDGQRDVTYNDIDGTIERAVEDGEKVKQDWPEDPPPAPAPRSEILAPPAVVEPVKPGRPPGKLFGKSLIDDLENRKAAMRAKQRVFTGDQRPSMMDRRTKMVSTLIDPASLQRRPSDIRLDAEAEAQGLNRRGSRNSKPLLSFHDNGELALTGLREDSRVPNSRSVFGVDTLWEREMTKLKEIEAQELKEAEERRMREDDEEAKRAKKSKKKNEVREHSAAEQFLHVPSPEEPSPQRHSSLPHVLPDIPKTTAPRRRAPVTLDESDEESSASEIGGVGSSSIKRDAVADKWVADDEDTGPVRTTGVGPRYPNRSRGTSRMGKDEGSDEDLPLSVTMDRVSRMLAARSAEDSDEDKPISVLIDKRKTSLPTTSLPKIDFDNLLSKPSSSPHSPDARSPSIDIKKDDDDEDNEPLGIRASRIPTTSQFSRSVKGGENNEDDDDRPLGMHPEQRRKMQYLLAQQQQQQQMMMQAQVAFGPTQSMMSASFTPFGPRMQSPMAPMMVIAPPQPFVSVHAQDAAKFSSVDKWRRDVAIEQS